MPSAVRKGVVFTLMAIILVSLLLVMLRLARPAASSYAEETAAADTRVTVLSTYAQTFEEQVSRSLGLAGYVAMKNMSLRVGRDHAFFDTPTHRLNATVAACVVNNTLNVSGAIRQCMPASLAFAPAVAQLVSLGTTELGVTTTYHIDSVWVSEERPLEVVFWIQLDYNVSDAFIGWTYENVTISAPVSMEGIPDPVYEFLANATPDQRTTERRNFSLTRLQRSQFTPTVLVGFIGNRSYLPMENRSPSVLQRLTGRTQDVSSCCGVESVLNPQALVNLPVHREYMNFSMTDHQFVSHVRGTLARYNCSSSAPDPVKARMRDFNGPNLVLDAWRFDSVYNTTAAALGAMPMCPDVNS